MRSIKSMKIIKTNIKCTNQIMAANWMVQVAISWSCIVLQLTATKYKRSFIRYVARREGGYLGVLMWWVILWIAKREGGKFSGSILRNFSKIKQCYERAWPHPTCAFWGPRQSNNPKFHVESFVAWCHIETHAVLFSKFI